VGEEGSEKTSRSPLALSFMIVSFSGVISELVANVSVIVIVMILSTDKGEEMVEVQIDVKDLSGKWYLCCQCRQPTPTPTH
jgi:hypothetical protein